MGDFLLLLESFYSKVTTLLLEYKCAGLHTTLQDDHVLLQCTTTMQYNVLYCPVYTSILYPVLPVDYVLDTCPDMLLVLWLLYILYYTILYYYYVPRLFTVSSATTDYLRIICGS